MPLFSQVLIALVVQKYLLTSTKVGILRGWLHSVRHTRAAPAVSARSCGARWPAEHRPSPRSRSRRRRRRGGWRVDEDEGGAA